MALQPVGPLPAPTYWRRRALVVAGPLALLALLTQCGGDPPPRTPTGAVTPRATPAVGIPTPRPTATRSPAAAASARPSPSRSAVAVGACPDGVLAITTSADAASYAAGSSPTLTLTVRNTGAVACRRDLGTGAVELRVLSGADRIWSSADCAGGTGADLLVLQPGASRSVVRTWSGRRSAPGCSGSRATAQPGTYRVLGRVGSDTGSGGTFLVR